MTRLFPALAAVVSLYAGQAGAQTAPIAPQHLVGTITAVTGKSLSLTAADGSNTRVDLLPNVSVTIMTPITVDQIQAGSFVATANKTQADGTGVSQELRVYPPDTDPKRFDVNRAMDQSGELIMTNGAVMTAVSVDGNRRLTVDYGSGTRTITVPPSIPVTLSTPGTLAQVQPGVKVEIYTIAASAGGPGRQSIRINKADLPK